MPKIKRAVRLEELARRIMSLTPGELETLAILMDRKEKEEDKLLTLEELFS